VGLESGLCSVKVFPDLHSRTLHGPAATLEISKLAAKCCHVLHILFLARPIRMQV